MKKTAKRKKTAEARQRNGKAARQRAFLAAYRSTASITRAAEAAKIDRGQHYDWMAEAAYAALFAEAQKTAAQALEDEAVRRAHEGIEEPLVYQGEFTYPQVPDDDEEGNQKRDEDGKLLWKKDSKPLTIRKYSDGLLQFLLRGFNSDKYRDKGSVELSGSIDITDRLNAARQRLQNAA